jgi:TRAP-type C4-dicarboxylate transport system permease small subunit
MYWYEAFSEKWLSNTVWRARLWIPYLSMPIGLGLVVLQYLIELLCLVTGRSPPFGIPEKHAAEDVARAQAREAFGDAP